MVPSFGYRAAGAIVKPTRPLPTHAFTLVEGLIVLTILAALLAAGLYFLNQRERARYQAIANSEPGKVFRVECAPDQPTFEEGKAATFAAHLFNITKHPLDFQIVNDGECWLALMDESGEIEMIALAHIVSVEDTPLPNDGPEVTNYPDGSISVETYSLFVVVAQNEDSVKLTMESPYIPPGEWTASLWLDTCGEHRGVLPSKLTPDHFVESPFFSLTITPKSDPE